MALEEKRILDMASWRPETATIEVRHANLILRDGTEISRDYHRHVVGPANDISDEDPEVQAMAETYAAERAAKAASTPPDTVN